MTQAPGHQATLSWPDIRQFALVANIFIYHIGFHQERKRIFIRKHMSNGTCWLENYSKLYMWVEFSNLLCELFLDYWWNMWDKRETKEKKWLWRKDEVICRGCWRKKEPAYICKYVIFRKIFFKLSSLEKYFSNVHL